MNGTTTRGKSVDKLTIVSGLGRQPEVKIDLFLSEAEKEKLYLKWKEEWVAPTEHRGGIKTLRCMDIKEVGYSKLSKVYGPRFAKKLTTIAEERGVNGR